MNNQALVLRGEMEIDASLSKRQWKEILQRSGDIAVISAVGQAAMTQIGQSMSYAGYIKWMGVQSTAALIQSGQHPPEIQAALMQSTLKLIDQVDAVEDVVAMGVSSVVMATIDQRRK